MFFVGMSSFGDTMVIIANSKAIRTAIIVVIRSF